MRCWWIARTLREGPSVLRLFDLLLSPGAFKKQYQWPDVLLLSDQLQNIEKGHLPQQKGEG